MKGAGHHGGTGAGAAFGTTFWALIDEGANAALGLMDHLTFGTVADATLRALDAVT